MSSLFNEVKGSGYLNSYWIAEDLERNAWVFLAQRRARSEISRFPEHTKGKNVEKEELCKLCPETNHPKT